MALLNEIQFQNDICDRPTVEALLLFRLQKALYPVKLQANDSCSTRVGNTWWIASTQAAGSGEVRRYPDVRIANRERG